MIKNFHVFRNFEELSWSAARLFIYKSCKAVKDRGRFVTALPGGTTPKRLFEILASEQFCHSVPWQQTIIFWSDERAVGPDHEWSNYRLAYDYLLAHVPIPTDNIFRIRGELGAKIAAEKLRGDMVKVFGKSGVPKFDLVLLGLGKDGHTASLFPHSDELFTAAWVAPVSASPSTTPVVDRVTLTISVLNATRTAFFLVAGKEKMEILSKIIHEPNSLLSYPAAIIKAENTIWYVDESAWPLSPFFTRYSIVIG